MDGSSPPHRFTKGRRGAPTGFFGVEAAGLRWLAVPGGADVARVIEVGNTHLTLTAVATARPSPRAAQDFGRRLARTHAPGASAFGTGPDGWSGDGFIGEARLTLRPHPTWGAFFAAERVLPYLAMARDGGALSHADAAVIEAVAGRLDDGDFDDPAAPARIHGDLWAGNVLFTETSATLIDPAAHGGHRLSDLAMLSLFGLPYLDEVIQAYTGECDQLPSGWRQLIGLHQLHPLLVHAVLFGGGYGERATQIARRYVGGHTATTAVRP